METALTLIVWVGVAIIGPPALLFWLIRRRRRREREAREAATAATLASTSAGTPPCGAATAPPALAGGVGAGIASSPAPAEPSGDYYRFPYGVPLVLYPLLVIALPAIGRTWLMALFELFLLFLAVSFAREGLSRAAFEPIRANDPSLNLATWRISWLVFFAAPPAVLALFGAVRLWKAWSG